MRSRLKWVVVVVFVLVLASVGAWIVSGPVAISAARREVEAVAGPRNALLAKYPARAAPNDAAVELERLCEPIYSETGATFAPKSRIAMIDAPPSAAALAGLLSWVQSQLMEPGAAIGEPPAEARELLVRLRPSLDAIASQLAKTQPAWELRPDTLAPEPNRRGVNAIVAMFLADAFIAQREGDELRAREALDAARASVVPLGGTPRWDAASTAVYQQSRVVVAARKLEGIDPAWVDGFAIDVQRAAVIDGLAWDAHAMLDIASDPRRLEEVRRLNKATRVQKLAVPAWKRSIARGAREDAAGIADLRDPAWACQGNRATTTMSIGPELAPEFSSSAEYSSGRLRELAFQLDLTREVLALKAERRRTGAWPRELPEIARSSCASVKLEDAQLLPAPRTIWVRAGAAAPRNLPRDWRSSP